MKFLFQMQSEMSSLETDFCPLLRGDPADPEDIANTLDQRLSVYVSAVKKTQEDIQNMMTRAEVMSYKGKSIIGSLPFFKWDRIFVQIVGYRSNRSSMYNNRICLISDKC